MLTHLTQNTDPKYGNGHLGVNISLLQKKCVILKNSNALDFFKCTCSCSYDFGIYRHLAIKAKNRPHHFFSNDMKTFIVVAKLPYKQIKGKIRLNESIRQNKMTFLVQKKINHDIKIQKACTLLHSVTVS